MTHSNVVPPIAQISKHSISLLFLLEILIRCFFRLTAHFFSSKNLSLFKIRIEINFEVAKAGDSVTVTRSLNEMVDQ